LNERIIQVSCGKKHTVVLGESRKLYSWGSNEFGQLGRASNITLKLNVKR